MIFVVQAKFFSMAHHEVNLTRFVSHATRDVALWVVSAVATIFALSLAPAAMATDQHWAFVLPQRPVPPQVADESWVRNPIDAFVLARLQQEGLRPSTEADANMLLRRLSLDLIGLPPTLDELEQWKESGGGGGDGDGYREQVDRLLKSAHFGERWARHWLDAARYADSDGFEKDKPREVWFYRDWVMRALNNDMPYDQFIIEQVAGDLLPNATQDQRVATGFLRNSMINEEGGADPEQFRMTAMFDRMDALGKSVLGLTTQCSQCHDHKYDPLTQVEYYQMFAFLNNSHEARLTVYTRDEEAKRQRLHDSIREIVSRLKQEYPDWESRMAAWEASVSNEDRPVWKVLELDFDQNSVGGQKMLPQPDGSYLAQSYAPTKTEPRGSARTDLPQVTAVRLELMTDPNLPRGGPGRSILGTCALTEFKVTTAPADTSDGDFEVKIAEATADVAPPETPLAKIFHDKTETGRVTGPVAMAIDGKDETAWGTDIGPGRRNQSCKAVFRFEKPISNANGTLLHITLIQKHGGWNSDDNQTHCIGRFRVSVTDSPSATADPLRQELRDILAIARNQRSPDQQEALFSYWRTTVAQWHEANEQIEELWRQHPDGTTQLVLAERETPRNTHRLARGDFLQPTEAVSPAVPAFLHPLQEGVASTRLEFARWLVDPRSPTTARAIVNRIWQSYFGVGLVATSDDLGTQCETPSHPGLLDWLATELMESGWSLKHIHRLIVSSSTYRQTSRAAAELYASDPQNRRLARGPRYRVDAEIVRDIALAASGLLDPTVGGRSVYPPAPAFLFEPPASYGPKTWNHDAGNERFRRGLYTFRFRSVPYPAMEVFDAPNGDFSCVRRARSNTPLQALTTLNEPLFVECAQALALSTLREGGAQDGQRLDYVFRRVLSRHPNDDDRRVLLGILTTQTDQFSSRPEQAAQLAFHDPANPTELPEDTTVADAAAWTAVSRIILNLDEAMTKQ